MISKLIAADIPLSPNEGFKGFGRLGLEQSNPETAPTIFNSFISGVIGVLTIVAGLWFIFVFVSGAIAMISSGGDKGALESARKRIFNALIGLVVVVASIFLIELVGKILGISLILNPAQFVENIWK
ncbi:MAG: hypothetical protein CH104c_0690 [Candidatus Woesebacteria bacterium]|nr:MAG: hypothetical protein CH104c_0690 [Candidatus Woesebacteria bacterium]